MPETFERRATDHSQNQIRFDSSNGVFDVTGGSFINDDYRVKPGPEHKLSDGTKLTVNKDHEPVFTFKSIVIAQGSRSVDYWWFGGEACNPQRSDFVVCTGNSQDGYPFNSASSAAMRPHRPGRSRNAGLRLLAR